MKILPEYYFTKPYSEAYRTSQWKIYQPNDKLVTHVSTRTRCGRISAKALVSELNYLHHRLHLVEKELADLKAHYALQPKLFHQLQLNSQKES